MVINCSLNALSGLYLSEMNMLSDHSYILQIINSIVDESYEVAKKIGVDFDKNAVLNMIKSAPPNFSSMYKDIIQGKDTEIDYLNGMIVKLGKENNIDTKINEQITILIKGLTNTIFSNNEELCQEEFEIIKKFFDNVKLIDFLRIYLIF
jgi:2-dehydropantoate 2-reductase